VAPPQDRNAPAVATPVPFGPEGVSHRRELTAAGVSDGRIRRAVAAGRWQEPVPGVVIAHGGPLSQRQRWIVAVKHAGPTGCLSHRSALLLAGCGVDELLAARRVAGVRGRYTDLPEGGMVEVSVPHGRHIRSSGFVVVHQSRRPLAVVTTGGLPATSPARGAVDVAITAGRRSEVDHVVSHVLQRRLATVADLVVETQSLGRRATPWLRAVVADATRGMRSVGESDLRRVVLMAGLPEPEWNAEVITPHGTFFVDALWRRQGVAAEADGATFHLSAADWSKDLRRQNAIHGVGIVLLRFPIRRLRGAPVDCGTEMKALLLPNGVAG
jgi:very-short-patch-repair endonuclease